MCHVLLPSKQPGKSKSQHQPLTGIAKKLVQGPESQEPQHCLQESQHVPAITGTHWKEHPCSLLPRHPLLPDTTVIRVRWDPESLWSHCCWEEECFELNQLFLHKSCVSVQDVVPQCQLCDSATAGLCLEQWWQVAPCHSVLARALQG